LERKEQYTRLTLLNKVNNESDRSDSITMDYEINTKNLNIQNDISLYQ